jgi:hypothetical protein
MLEIIRIFSEKKVSLADEIKELFLTSSELKNAAAIVAFIEHRAKIQDHINVELIKRLQS